MHVLFFSSFKKIPPKDHPPPRSRSSPVLLLPDTEHPHQERERLGGPFASCVIFSLAVPSFLKPPPRPVDTWALARARAHTHTHSPVRTPAVQAGHTCGVFCVCALLSSRCTGSAKWGEGGRAVGKIFLNKRKSSPSLLPSRELDPQRRGAECGVRGSKLKQRKSPPTHSKALGGWGMAMKECWGRHGD